MPSAYPTFTASPTSVLTSRFLPSYEESMSSVTNTTCGSKSKEEKLLSLMDRTGYPIVQENGQRKYGPPPTWTGPYPPKGCEVFVGKLPRDLYEDELVPVFEEVGLIYEVRLMMDFSGTNRGFAFVMYTTPEDAKRAIKTMNNYEIRKGKIIGVCKSVDNCRLFVGGIPKTKTKTEIKNEMEKVTEGVVDVILYSSVNDKTKNRGFAFVEYENHRAAAMARRKLIPGKIPLWGHEIAVDWAEPEPEVDEETMSKVTVLYARNLMPDTSEDQIRDMFSMKGVLKVEKVKKLRDFAFVHYTLRQDAQTALEQLNECELGGSVVEVTWAKPADRVNRRGASATRNGTMPIVASYPAGPIVYGQNGFEMLYGPAYGYQPSAMQAPSGGPGGLMVSRVAIRGRSNRGAAGIKGMRGGMGFNGRTQCLRRPAEYHFYDLQPNMELIPTNTYTMKSTASPVQILMDVCQKNNWGEPIFNLHSTVHPETGDNVQLYLYKVSIPGMPSQYNQFQPPRVCQYMEEAKQYAAQHVLSQLGVTIDSVEGNPALVSGAMPTTGSSPMAPSTGPYNRVSFIGTAPPAFDPGYYEPIQPAYVLN